MSRNRVKLSINENVINEFKRQNISVEYMGSIIFILFALDENKIDLLDVFDDKNTQKRSLLLYDHLVNKSLLSRADLEEAVHYTLTEEGVNFVDFLRSELNSENTDFVADIDPEIKENVERIIERKAIAEDPEEWIDDYIKIFPKEKVGGRYLRTGKLECLAKMQWFIKTYKFNKDTILKATKAYISNQENDANAYNYTRNSGYFISKQTGQGREGKVSDLATWCERISNGEEDSKFDTSIMNSA